jgi:methionine-rich copper-binding protein CopC
MKRKLILALSLIGILMLSSCAKKNTQGTISPDILVAVGQTLTAQYTPMADTATPAPTETATPLGSPTIGVPTVMSFPTSTSSCDNAVFVADVTIPDNTVIAKSTTFTKTWTLRNSGSCAWSATYKLKFVSGEQMGGASVAVGETVASGSTTNLSISMTAPATAGTYTGYWRMINDDGTFFGEAVYVKIVVGSATTTTTTTVTATTIATNTPWIITATPEPSATPETPVP